MHTQTKTYQVIPRKFRPQTFETVVGQEAIVTTLKNALRFNRLAHAYLFCGCRGTGKTTLARVFAKALNCQQLTPDLEPCNTCPSCTEIMSGRSLDVLEIDGASNRGIDDIRQINETIGYAPASGKYKIYIIDEVHMLTKEAFNALLKTLEEPPPNVKFFFATTEPHKVLPTIISRCQRFDLNRIPQTSMEQKLAYIAKDLGVECEPQALSLIAHLSEGSLRDAESLLDQVICYAQQPIKAQSVSDTLGLMPKESFFALDKAMAENQCSFAFELSQTLFSSGKDLSYFLDNLIEHFRTLLLIKFNKPCLFLNTGHEEHYKKAAPLYTEEQCLYILDYLIQWQQQLTKSPFKRIGLEMILLHIIRSKNRIAFSTLVKKLSEIQDQAGSPQPVPSSSPAAQPTLEARQMPEAVAEVAAAPAPKPMPKAEPKLTKEPVPKPMPKPMQAPEAVVEVMPEDLAPKLIPIELPEPPKTVAEVAIPPQTSIPEPIQAPQATVPTSSIEEILFNKVKNKLSAPKKSEEMVDVVQKELNKEEAPSTEKTNIYSNNLKNWEFGKEAPQNFRSERMTIAEGQGMSEDENSEEKPTQPKTNFSSCLGITPPLNAQSRYDTLIRFASVELEGVIKNEK